jgi:Domain of unknown function (DUF4399)
MCVQNCSAAASIQSEADLLAEQQSRSKHGKLTLPTTQNRKRHCMHSHPLKTKRALYSCFLALGASAALLLSGCAGMSNPNQPPSDKGVWFMEPQNGTTVGQTFKVKFGVKGMDVEAAGDQNKGKGHHHLLVNLMSKPAGEIIPFDDKHIHFGKGQTEAEVKLPPGQYKLTMQFADGFHLSYGKEMATTIEVTVK